MVRVHERRIAPNENEAGVTARRIMNKTKVAIIEKQNLVRECLALLIGMHPSFEMLGHWESSQEALPHITNNAPDIILFDVCEKRHESRSTMFQLRSVASQTRIMALTDHLNLDELIMLFKLGVTGYISKHATTDAFLDAIREVKKGKPFVDIGIREALISRYLECWPSGKSGNGMRLSPREQEVFHLLGQGYMTKDVASLLGLSRKTVELHKYHVMRKLSLHNQADLIRYAAHQGMAPAELLKARESTVERSLTFAEERSHRLPGISYSETFIV